jgi:hypothetical protein
VGTGRPTKALRAAAARGYFLPVKPKNLLRLLPSPIEFQMAKNNFLAPKEFAFVLKGTTSCVG